MNMVPIEGSSNIKAIGYEGNELRVRFKNGALYAAHGVPPEDHEHFMAADSKGKHFGALRILHAFARVEEE